jgi:hypothetical protein
MRHVVLQFWLSLDGYSCDEDTELCRLMEEIEDPWNGLGPSAGREEPGGQQFACGSCPSHRSAARPERSRPSCDATATFLPSGAASPLMGPTRTSGRHRRS